MSVVDIHLHLININIKTMNMYVSVLKNFKDFSGRSSRKEFWTFILINLGISIILSIVGALLNFTLIGTLFGLITLVPSIAVWVRRMHDVGKEWWYLLIPFYNFYLAIQISEEGTNRFGAQPMVL